MNMVGFDRNSLVVAGILMIGGILTVAAFVLSIRGH
jgi:hypothetical protein